MEHRSSFSSFFLFWIFFFSFRIRLIFWHFVFNIWCACNFNWEHPTIVMHLQQQQPHTHIHTWTNRRALAKQQCRKKIEVNTKKRMSWCCWKKEKSISSFWCKFSLYFSHISFFLVWRVIRKRNKKKQEKNHCKRNGIGMWNLKEILKMIFF